MTNKPKCIMPADLMSTSRRTLSILGPYTGGEKAHYLEDYGTQETSEVHM